MGNNTLTLYQIVKIVKLSRTKSMADIAKDFDLKYIELRSLLRSKGLIIKRGRKAGSGIGMRTGGKDVDRRVKYIIDKIEEGKCTSCGELNDSSSLYHCRSCLDKRNRRKQGKSLKFQT